MATPALAAEATFSWDYNAADQAGITGFRLYQGDTAAGAQTPIAEVSADKRSITVPVPYGRAWYVIRAYNAQYESDPSNQVAVDVTPPTVTPPAIPVAPGTLNVQVNVTVTGGHQ
jgi:hypothetical protein